MLLDAQQVAGGVTDRAVTDAAGLINGLLDDLGAVGLKLRKRGIQVWCGKDEHRAGAFCHHLANSAALRAGDARVNGGRVQDNRSPSLAGWADCDPTHLETRRRQDGTGG